MRAVLPSPLRRARRAASLLVLAMAAACGGGADEPGAESGATADDVDASSSATVTEEEQASFTPPADSVLTPAQVDAYLRTALLQFDLIRAEAPAMHAQAQRMEERGKDGGMLSGLRNMADAASLVTRFGDVIGGSYVRAARTLKQNPAEMEWVRERMGEVGGFLLTKPMFEQQVAASRTLRAQVDSLRQQAEAGTLEGFEAEQLGMMEQQAAEMERSAQEQLAQAGSASQRNLEVLRQARSNVTERMWATVAMTSGAQALLPLTGLANPQDSTAQRQLAEWRTLYTDAVANRVTRGMEDGAADES